MRIYIFIFIARGLHNCTSNDIGTSEIICINVYDTFRFETYNKMTKVLMFYLNVDHVGPCTHTVSCTLLINDFMPQL